MNSKSFIHLSKFHLLIILLVFSTYYNLNAQENETVVNERKKFLKSTRELISEVRFCALITQDEDGQAHVRIMDPFAPDENFIIWFGTNTNSRKAEEIRSNENVTLYYADPNGSGYVSIMGKASLVDDPDLKERWWKEEWKAYYPKGRKNYILIKVIPEEIEVINYKNNITGDKDSWEVPSAKF